MRPTLTVLGMLLSFLLTALAAPMPLPMAPNPNVARLQMGRRAPAPAPVPREASRSRENVLNNMMRVRGAGKQAMRDRLAEQQRLVRERLADEA